MIARKVIALSSVCPNVLALFSSQNRIGAAAAQMYLQKLRTCSDVTLKQTMNATNNLMTSRCVHQFACGVLVICCTFSKRSESSVPRFSHFFFYAVFGLLFLPRINVTPINVNTNAIPSTSSAVGTAMAYTIGGNRLCTGCDSSTKGCTHRHTSRQTNKPHAHAHAHAQITSQDTRSAFVTPQTYRSA